MRSNCGYTLMISSRSLERCITCMVTMYALYSHSNKVKSSLRLVLGLIWRQSRSYVTSRDTVMICTDSWYKIFGFGWTFDELRITAQRRHCETLYAAGRAEEAKEVLLKILDTSGDVRASGWVMGGYRHLNWMDLG